MKKPTYIQPIITIVRIEGTSLLVGSPDIRNRYPEDHEEEEGAIWGSTEDDI